jgi:hypothetical protein
MIYGSCLTANAGVLIVPISSETGISSAGFLQSQQRNAQALDHNKIQAMATPELAITSRLDNILLIIASLIVTVAKSPLR